MYFSTPVNKSRRNGTAAALILTLVLVGDACLAASRDVADGGAHLPGWAFSAGIYDSIDSDTTGETSIEYRGRAFRVWRLDLKPMVGVSTNAESAVWVYGGFRYDLPWRTRNFVPTFSFAVALYDDGDSKDLGGPVQFRSALDLAWVLADGQRVGISIYHMSNARLYELNPGEESVVLFWSLGR